MFQGSPLRSIANPCETMRCEVSIYILNSLVCTIQRLQYWLGSPEKAKISTEALTDVM
jgi:hypothetical protein